MMRHVTLFLFLSLSVFLKAQSFNIGIAGGYAAPIATSFNDVLFEQFQNQTFPYYYTTYRSVARTSYGMGGNINVTLDWYSAKNIGCGLNFNTLISTPFSYSADVNYLGGTRAIFNFKDKPLSFQFIPHINFKHDFKKVSPYVEMGMLIAATHIKEDYDAVSSSGSNISSSVTMSGNVLLGFYSSLGILVRISQAVRFTAAVNCTAGSYSPAKWTRTVFVVNGTNELNSLSTSDKQGIYVKQLDLTATQAVHQPSQSLKFSIPFSNVAFNVGFTFVIATKGALTPEQIKRREKITHEINNPSY